MIIPIRCFTCGKVLADKWEYYKREVELLEKEKEADNKDPKFEGIRTKEVLDKLGLEKMCCRRHMLGHVDLMHII
jgi:DNA-directed RNA polymerase I, II, and III subunit RPABC5